MFVCFTVACNPLGQPRCALVLCGCSQLTCRRAITPLNSSSRAILCSASLPAPPLSTYYSICASMLPHSESWQLKGCQQLPYKGKKNLEKPKCWRYHLPSCYRGIPPASSSSLPGIFPLCLRCQLRILGRRDTGKLGQDGRISKMPRTAHQCFWVNGAHWGERPSGIPGPALQRIRLHRSRRVVRDSHPYQRPQMTRAKCWEELVVKTIGSWGREMTG